MNPLPLKTPEGTFFSLVTTALVLAAVSVQPCRAAVFDFSEATNNATVQPGGPRTGTSGKNFLNIEGSVNGSFASYGVADFSLSALGTVSISEISVRFTESNASFTQMGSLNFWLTSDNTTSIEPGSSLIYDAGSTPDGIGSQLSTLYMLGSGSFTTVGNVNSGMTDTYTFNPSLGNQAAFNYLESVALSGGTVRVVVSPGDANVAATWAGFSNTTYSGPELSFQYAVPEPQTYVLLLAGLGLGSLVAIRRRRASLLGI